MQAQGVANLLSDIVRFFPSPDKRKCAGINRRTNEIFEGNYEFSKAKTAYVFKTMVDPFIGKYSFVKVCSGVLKGDDILYNADADAEEKPGKIYAMAEINRRKFPNCLQEISGLSQNSAVHARAIRFLQRQIRYLMRKQIILFLTHI